MPASLSDWRARIRNATLAKPRGPNQPTNNTVDQCIFLPRSARATASIRTTVRLKSA